MFEINIKTDNAAFEEPYCVKEIDRILQETISLMEIGKTEGVCRDINGNAVGNWRLR